MGKKNGSEPGSFLGRGCEGGKGKAFEGLIPLGGSPGHRSAGEGHLGRALPSAPERQAAGRSKDFNSSRLILLSCNNIDMLLFSIFIHPPAKKERLPPGHS